MISVHFQGKPFNITVIQVYAPTSNAEKDEIEWFYEALQDLLELTPKKRCPFHHRGLECKSRKLRHTWSKRQIWPWSTKWSRVCQENTLVIAKTLFQQHKRRLHTDITRWSTLKSDWFIFFEVKDGEALYSQQKQDHKLTVAQIMNSLLPNSDLNWRK